MYFPCHHKSWSWNRSGCFAWWVTRPTARAGGDLHMVQEKWKSFTQQKLNKRSAVTEERHTLRCFDQRNVSLWTRQDENQSGTIISMIVFIITGSVSSLFLSLSASGFTGDPVPWHWRTRVSPTTWPSQGTTQRSTGTPSAATCHRSTHLQHVPNYESDSP